MAKRLAYRVARESDIPSLVRLRDEGAGWGALTADQWQAYHVTTPFGPSIVVVAEDERGDVAGQLILRPMDVLVGAKRVAALRLSEHILRRDVRHVTIRNMSHPTIGLFYRAMEAAVANGYQIIYSLPYTKLLPVFKWHGGFMIAEYPCVSIPIRRPPVEKSDDITRLTVSPATHFDERYEALWQSAVENFPIHCGVVRSPDWLRYRYGGALVLEVLNARDNSLAGYAAIDEKRALLADIIATTPAELLPVLTAALNWLATRRDRNDGDGIEDLKVMETPILRLALRALGFTPVDYTFPFVVHEPLNPALSRDDIAPDRWHIMLGD